jgi:alpha-beta hydrolase superfamily lysophospholipase
MENASENEIDRRAGRIILAGHLSSSDGNERLYYKRNSPERGNSRRHVIIIHDFSDYHGNYLAFGNHLLELLGSDCTITWFDLRGHGLSTGTRGHVEKFDDLCLDIVTLIETLNRLELPRPILFGQGLGGLLALRLQQHHRHLFTQTPLGLIVVNPLLRVTISLPNLLESALGVFSGPLARCYIPYRIRAIDLCRDEKRAQMMDSDPLFLNRISFGLYREILESSNKVRASSYFIDAPTLVVTSEKDNVTDAETAKLFCKGLPEKRGRFLSFDMASHDLTNDPDRDKFALEVYNWINTLSEIA